MNYYSIKKEDWDSALGFLLKTRVIYAVIENNSVLDYDIITSERIDSISYNKPKPATPLKYFFLPFRENVTSNGNAQTPVVIIGPPNCDVEGLNILDEIYLDKDFPDPFYRNRRTKTTIISCDCFSINEDCHCMAYNVTPFAQNHTDVSLSLVDGNIFLKVFSDKGEEFIKGISSAGNGLEKINSSDFKIVGEKNNETVGILKEKYGKLPDYTQTGNLIKLSEDSTWIKYSSTCVSCGACTTICPTCSCFLLIDLPGFNKVRQTDACQYPGFERVAGGEDSLHKLYIRFRNRYMCKYVWKPEKFKSIACTGCGRCIEGCIGKINKNELFMELAK